MSSKKKTISLSSKKKAISLSSKKKSNSLKKKKTSSVPLYELTPSTLAKKKFDVYVESPSGHIKKVSFGHSDYEDYTIHKDPERRKRYLNRHRNDHIDDPTAPGFWSYHVLWGPYTSLQKNLTRVKKMYHLQ